MSIAAILIIIGIISSVINAMQPNKTEKLGSLKTRIKQVVSPLSEQRMATLKRTVIGTHEKIRRGEERAQAHFFPSEQKIMERVLEKKATDFGDPETVYSPIESMELGASVPRPKTEVSQFGVPSKRSTLDLKPTPKKLAETLVLAEILSVPRAKKPHQFLGYKKR